MRHPILLLPPALAALLISPADAAAQLAPPRPAITPRLLVGAGTGPHSDRANVIGTNVVWLSGRNLAIEAEWQRWQEHTFTRWTISPGAGGGLSGNFSEDRRWSGWSTGSTVLFRTEQRPLIWYAGGGVSWTSLQSASTLTVTDCTPPQQSSIPCPPGVREFRDAREGFGLHGLTTVEGTIANRVSAYGSFRWIFAPDPIASFTAGLRVAPWHRNMAGYERRRARSVAAAAVSLAGGPGRIAAPPPIGRDVEVVFDTGGRIRGPLTALTEKDVTIGHRQYSLTHVLLIERLSHKARNFGLIGAGGGAVTGFVVAAAVCGADGECMAAVPLFAVIGGAGAAVVGMLIDHAEQPRHVVWTPPRRLAVAPLVTSRARGVGLVIRW